MESLFIAVTIVVAFAGLIVELYESYRPRHLYVISIGGGIASTLLLVLLAIAKYGHRNIRLFHCFIPDEDPDVLKLISAIENLTGLKVDLIGLNKTRWDIFFEEKMIGNSRLDPCSRLLKREQAAEYIATHFDITRTTLLVGIGYDEYLDRWPAIQRNWLAQGWDVVAPLADDPTITRETQLQLCYQILGWVPSAYLKGFKHLNCNKKCVKQGKGDWARLLWYDRNEYLKEEAKELEFQQTFGVSNTILRDERSGQPTVPCSLKTHRERMEAKWATMNATEETAFKPPFIAPHEFTRPCISCEAI